MTALIMSIMISGLSFTFDDGPSIKHTPQILSILKKHNIKAIFCWPADQLNNKKKLAIAKRALKEGHILCNHSVNHPEFNKISRRKQIAQIVNAQKVYKKKLNYIPKYFRPPHGIITKTMRQTVKKLGMKMLLWEIDSKDWYIRTTSKIIYNRVISRWVKRMRRGKNSIVLFHDINGKTVKVLNRIIERIKRGLK